MKSLIFFWKKKSINKPPISLTALVVNSDDNQLDSQNLTAEKINVREYILPTSLKVQKELIKLGKKIGSGKTSKVYEATYEDKTVAIKALLYPKQHKPLYENELRFLSYLTSLNAPHIIKLLGYVQSDMPTCSWLMMAYLANGHLLTMLLDETNKIPTDLRLKWLIQITEAVDFLHANEIIHRDIKSLNVLLNGNLDAHLGDFGSACFAATKNNSFAGTIIYAAPEAISFGGATFASDIYSLGMFYYEVLSRKIPYSEFDSDFSKQKMQGLELIIPEHWPKPIKKVIHENLQQQPDLRPSAHQCLTTLKLFASKNKVNEFEFDKSETKNTNSFKVKSSAY